MSSKEEILHHSLHHQMFQLDFTFTSESGVLAVENCQPSVGQLDVYELFRGTAQCHQKSFVQTENVVRVQLLHSQILS